MNKSFLSLLAIAFVACSAFAQTSTTPVVTPTTPVTTIVAPQTQQLSMISSRGALRAYALSLVADVDGTLYSNTDSSVYDYRSWVGQKNSVEILGYIKGFKLSMDTSDPTQDFSVYIAARSAVGETLFSGYSTAKPVQVAGKWTLPSQLSNVTLNMNAVPIKMDKQVSYATIVAKDANGNTQTYQLASDGNSIYLSGDSAGLPNAYIRIVYTDGTTASYDLENDGKLKSTFPLGLSVSPTFNDVVSFTNPAKVTVSVKSDHGQGVVPTIEVISSSATSYTFDVQTSDAKKPKTYWIKTGTADWVSIPAVVSGVQTITIPTGITYVVPEFSPSDFIEVLYPVQTGGGGKG